eukprot:Gb_38342 [translate_table: standard]
MPWRTEMMKGMANGEMLQEVENKQRLVELSDSDRDQNLINTGKVNFSQLGNNGYEKEHVAVHVLRHFGPMGVNRTCHVMHEWKYILFLEMPSTVDMLQQYFCLEHSPHEPHVYLDIEADVGGRHMKNAMSSMN